MQNNILFIEYRNHETNLYLRIQYDDLKKHVKYLNRIYIRSNTIKVMEICFDVQQ